MKVFLSLIFCLSLCACNARHEAEAVSAVMERHDVALADAVRVQSKRGRSVTNFVPAKYVESLHMIYTSNCPPPFRVAWLNYVQTCDRRLANGNVKGGAELLDGNYLHSAALVKDGMDKVNSSDTAEAWRKVQMVAVQFGVGH